MLFGGLFFTMGTGTFGGAERLFVSRLTIVRILVNKSKDIAEGFMEVLKLII